MRILACFILASAAAWTQNYYYFPIATDGATANGTTRTSIIITNPGTLTASVTVAWSNDDASAHQVTIPDLGSDSSFSFDLAPGATRILQTSGTSDPSSGAAAVAANQVINVWGVQSTVDGLGAVRAEAAFAAVTPSTGFQMAADSNTGIAFFNPGSATATITANLLDSSGASAGSQTFTLAGGARITRLISNDLFGDLSGFAGTLNITATSALAAQAIRSGSGAILEATPLTSKRMRFYFPKLADGPSSTATYHTTFLITNLSNRPATVTATLTHEDGSPWVVAIPGVDTTTGTFQATLAPGTSSILQTDGTSPYGTGAAAIKSDAPIGVQALVTASDSQGASLTETGALSAKLQQQFTLPFDVSSDLIAGGTLYNPGSQPATLTLTLSDADGAATGASQTITVPPGGQVGGLITDFFAGTPTLRGTLTVDAGTAFVSALAFRQNQNLQWPSTLPSAAIPLNGAPIQVTSTVDDSKAVTASIGAKGGSLSLTDAAGDQFTLTIPPNALFATEKIVMTPVTSTVGVPGTGLAAIQLAPDGLALLQPATLSIQPASGAADAMTPIGWYGASTPGVYLNLLQPNTDQFTMLLTHFSSAGGASLTPGDLTSVLLNVIDKQDYYDAQIAGALKAQAMDDVYRLLEVEFDQVIAPLMEIALASQDDNVIQCAIFHAVAYLKKVEVMGADEDGSSARTIDDFVQAGRHILILHATSRCVVDHDFTALIDLLGLIKQDQILGGTEPIPDYAALQSQCSDQLQFQITSLILSHYTPGGYFKGQISSTVPLTGAFDKTVLDSVTDPTVDLYASYQFSGSAPSTYDTFAFETDDGECTIVANGLRPGPMTVVAAQPDGKKSQVQFKFSAGYDPTPYAQNGVQLCAFCPIYSRKLEKVDALIYPGLNWEDITDTCPLVGAQMFSDLFWNDGWDTLHPMDPTSGFNFFPNWDLVVTSDRLAQLKSILSVTAIDHSTVESTTMILNRIAPPPK